MKIDTNDPQVKAAFTMGYVYGQAESLVNARIKEGTLSPEDKEIAIQDYCSQLMEHAIEKMKEVE